MMTSKRSLPFLPFLVLALLSAIPAALAADPAQADEPVAIVGDQEITRAEVLEAAAPQLAKLRQQEYDILKQALDRIVEEHLLEAAAKKEGKTVDEYLKEKIDSKVVEPSDDEIKETYEKYKSKLRGQTLEQARQKIVDFLKRQQMQQLYQDLIASLRKETKVRVMLEPPRVEVSTDDDPALGPADAPVTIVAFSDYQCPFCGRAERTMKRVLENYKGKVRYVFRDFPLSFHQHAMDAAQAAGCVYELGGTDSYWAYHDKLFENQRSLDKDSLAKFAKEVGVDEAKFKECLESGRRQAEVEKDLADGQRLGVSGTPAFFVNGRLISGAQPYESFQEVIDDELARRAK